MIRDYTHQLRTLMKYGDMEEHARAELGSILEQMEADLEADRARLARCPVLTVTEATTADGATLTGDRDAQRRAADLLHQDVRLVPVR